MRTPPGFAPFAVAAALAFAAAPLFTTACSSSNDDTTPPAGSDAGKMDGSVLKSDGGSPGPSSSDGGGVEPASDAGHSGDAGAARDGGAATDAGTDGGAKNDGGSGASGRATGTGSIGGQSVAGITNALAEVTTDADKGSELDVVLTQFATCANATTGPVASEIVLDMALYSIATDGSMMSIAAAAPGTYSLDVDGDGPYADVDILTLDTTCNEDENASAGFDSGTVTITAISGDVVTGSYSLTAGTDTISGTFTTVMCTGASNLDSDPTEGSTCPH